MSAMSGLEKYRLGWMMLWGLCPQECWVAFSILLAEEKSLDLLLLFRMQSSIAAGTQDIRKLRWPQVLGIKLGGTNAYDGVIHEGPVFNPKGDVPSTFSYQSSIETSETNIFHFSGSRLSVSIC